MRFTFYQCGQNFSLGQAIFITHLHEHGLILWFEKYFYFLERSSFTGCVFS
ncbi:hypothetical protein HMPREF1603_00370 [Escherichia coli 907892]|nr:hypothetical protein HMPREF1603_00370 [Escherichia coli 907892]